MTSLHLYRRSSATVTSATNVINLTAEKKNTSAMKHVCAAEKYTQSLENGYIALTAIDISRERSA